MAQSAPGETSFLDDLRLVRVAVVNIWDKGTFNAQGKEKSTVETIPSGRKGDASTRGSRAPSNKVFVVYGHDTNARTQLEAMLRRWGIDPLITDQLLSEGQTIIEKLENYAFDVYFLREASGRLQILSIPN